MRGLGESHSVSELLENIFRQSVCCDVGFRLLPVPIFNTLLGTRKGG